MFSKEEINKLIALCESNQSDNNIVRQDIGIKPFLVELKVQIDRWDFVTDTFIFHPCIKDYIILQSLKKDIRIDQNGNISLWGANIIFNTEMPLDKVLALCLPYTASNNGRNIALGILDINEEEMKRLINLKAFW